MILKSVFHITLLLLWPLNTLAEQAASPLTKHHTTSSIEFSLRIEANQNFSRWFDISYGPDISPFIESINLKVLEILVGQEKLFYCTKLCLAYIPSSTSLFNKKQCNESFYFTERQGSRITVLKNLGEMSALIPDATDWKIHSFSFHVYAGEASSPASKHSFSFDVYAGEASSPASKFLNKGLAYVLKKVIGARLGGFFLLVGTSLICIGLFLLMGTSWLCIVIRKTKKINLRKLFMGNGGLLLQQMVNSYDGSVDRCRLFNERELDKATDHFNVNRILGQGGQGTVYRGMLEDGRIIAVKKFKILDEEKLEEFVNELVILSQINHRNVVKLLGGCLQTEVPLLVYEFIPNGTLFEYIHNRNEEFPLTWEMRLRIATEVAGAVSYLHSAAAIPIYHRDIKSTNILLDEKYRAKVGDFGTSKFIAIDQTHVSTVVLGTLGYLDPEYYQSSQLTDKSDVYSFGVVLVELLTGKKPIYSTTSQENVNLAKFFVHAVKENRLYDILDDQVKKMGKKKEIMAFANLAKRCLYIKGKERPTMKEVATELEGIRVLKKKKAMLGKFMKIFSK